MDSHPKTYILLIFGRNLKQEITSPPLPALRLRREQSKFTCYAEPQQRKGAQRT